MLTAFAPLVVGFLLFGSAAGSLLSVVSFLTILAVSVFTGEQTVIAFAFIPVLVFTGVVMTLIRRGLSPQRVTVYSSLFFLGLGLFFGSIAVLSGEGGYYALCDQMIGNLVSAMGVDQVPQLKEFSIVLTEGSSFGVKIKYLFPSFLSIAGLFQIWIGMFLVMMFSRGWRKQVNYKYSMKSFLDYRNSEYVIYPFILLLGTYLLGYYLKLDSVLVFTVNILFVFAIFFIFHGLGVYVEFLKFLKIRGFFKAFLTIIAFVFMYQLLTIIGVFDLWVNFRKFFKREIES